MSKGNTTKTAERKVWNVYLLQMSDNSVYCGVTIDMARRLQAHAKGKASKYTRSRLPIKKHIYVYGFTKSEALQLEAKIKKLPKAEKAIELSGQTKNRKWGGSLP